MTSGNERRNEAYLEEVPVLPSRGLSQFLREWKYVDHLVVGQVRERSCVVCQINVSSPPCHTYEERGLRLGINKQSFTSQSRKA